MVLHRMNVCNLHLSFYASSLLSFPPSQSYEFYIAWMYVGVAVLLSSLALAAWVSWCFTKNHFPYIW